MPRSLRWEYPGAYYHVLARGNRQEAIFHDDVDRRFFLCGLGALALELAQELFQGVQVVRDGAQGADLAAARAFGDGDGDGFFVDIEAHEEDGLRMRLSVVDLFIRELRTRLAGCVFDGSTRTRFRATRGSSFPTGKRFFFPAKTEGCAEGTQPLGLGDFARVS